MHAKSTRTHVRSILCLCALVLTMIALSPSPRAISQGGPDPTRRVNVWLTPGSVIDDDTAPIFWFGRVTEHDNYVDVRIGYTHEMLYVFVSTVDYYLWERETDTEDPRGYDAIALYLDTSGDRSPTPQPDDFFFVNGWRNWPNGNSPSWHREGRGTGGGWDESWAGLWTESVGANWYNSGPNDNSDRDAGWAAILRIPFTSLYCSGPPAPGTMWGMGVYLYDRDASKPAALVTPASWPETFSATAPASWGQLAFSPPAYQPQATVPEGTAIVRRGLGSSIVADAYVGGGGNCQGGIFGGSDINYGDQELFVASQSLIADFPCWSKSYLRFGLEAVPPGKVILSATLTLYLWGNAGPVPSQSPPSFTQLFAIREDWNELNPGGITWNNAPLASENLSATWVYARTDSGPDFPGVPYDWDATQAVAEAYAADRPFSVALYTADTHFDSSKYFLSSEAGDWIVPPGRPTLTIIWGAAAPGATKMVSPSQASTGQTMTYTIRLVGAGTDLSLNDPIPAGLVYAPGSATGGATFDSSGSSVKWSDTLASGETRTITFAVTVSTAEAAAIVNTATISDGIHPPLAASALAIVNGHTVYLPVTFKTFRGVRS